MKANLDKNLAPAWVSGKSYSTGEFCLYNKRLYICITDNSDAEFDNSKWERRNLVDLVSGINSNLDYRKILVKKGSAQNGVSISLSGATYQDGYILLTSNGTITITADLTNFKYASMSILGYSNIPKIKIDGGNNNLGSTLDISSYTGEHNLTFLTNGNDKVLDIWLE